MTEQSIKLLLQKACQALLRPIASVLLKTGMTWKEFSDISKTVFVSVATDEFGIRGRPTNVSKTSILTGISRKEVKRQRDLIQEGGALMPNKTTDASRLLTAWYQDSDYVDEQGEPMTLTRHGPAPSFQSLFDTYGGDTPEQTLIKELSGVGSIEIDDDGQLHAKRRYHMPVQTDIGHIQVFCSILIDHANTLSKNLYGDETERLIEGMAINHSIDPDALDAFREFADQRGQLLLEEIDEWLSGHCIDVNSTEKTPIRLGLGVYGFEDKNSKGRTK